MVSRSVSSRLALAALAVGLVAAGGAGAQVYIYEEVVPYGYGRDYGYDRGFERPLPPRPIGRLSSLYGLAQIDRTVRTGAATVIDGRRPDGVRVRLVIDRYSGEVVDRIVLKPAPRPPAPRVARVAPEDEERPAVRRLVPRPPERPPALKPPAEASAPATIVPRPPAAPQRQPSLIPDPDPPPQRATAPAVVVPPAPASRPADAPEQAKPGLVNPRDVRGTEEQERSPPLAQGRDGGISVPPIELPPVQIEELRSTQPPKPATETAPVAPLE